MTDTHDSRKERSRIYAEAKRRKNGIEQVKGTTKVCCDCKSVFERKSHKNVRCRSCQLEFVREKARQVSRQKSEQKKARKIGSTDVCNNCKCEYVVNNPRSKYCKACKLLQKKNALPQMKEHSKKYKAAYMKNPVNKRKVLDTINKYARKRRKTDILFSIVGRYRARLNEVFRVTGYTKRSRTYEILGCSYDFLIQHIESQFVDGMCWERRNEIHIDHIIPLATAKTEEDVIRLSHYTNLQPLWAEDNLRKSNRLDFQL